MKTKTLSILMPSTKRPRPEAVVALIDDIIQLKIEKGDLPEVLKKKQEPETPPKNESAPFVLPEFYDWMIKELESIDELPRSFQPGETW